ncbi:MAG: glycosyltransferase family 2 protein [Acidobacteriota bacterium]|nr:glycosyltransferase family 2 protein [Blastocatellia bacterium]MDW8411240.1 glycosyltransferase family 2 protein [Acidobacteriota bacterium]
MEEEPLMQPLPPVPGYEKFIDTNNISFLYSLDTFDIIIISLYFGILFLLSIYGFYRLKLVYTFLRYQQFVPKPKRQWDKLPSVTIQLPLFNELYVVERLIKAVSEIDYPRELLEIQVLDDSTDETVEIARRAVEEYRKKGFDISYIHRNNRHGFKAGALQEGLKIAKGEFIAVFDADFIPQPDCIRKMIDYFTDEMVGMVQMRWSYINRNYNLLTKIQAIMLDGHFVVEQTARNRSSSFFNFNGTAGMWRRQAIEYSGGWQHDTLTEDTDLSYRAQMMGWKFVYLVDEAVPSELPVEINAFKAQQRRWAKGLIQVAIKLLPRILRHPQLPLEIKLELFFRLTNNIAAVLMIALALLHLPVLIVRYNQGFFHLLLFDVPILLFSTLSVIAFYGSAQRYLYPDTHSKQFKYLPLVMAVGIGLTFSNAKAVLEALLGIQSSFVRTPKYAIKTLKDGWLAQAMKYGRKRGLTPYLELLTAAYFALTIYYAITRGIFGTIPFLLIFLFGYAYTGAMSFLQSILQRFAQK